MELVKESINEMNSSAYEDKSHPHEDFIKVKELLLIEINKYVKKKLNGNIDIMTSEIEDLLAQDPYEEVSIWKKALVEKHIDPIIEHINLLRDELDEFRHIEEVGDLNFSKPEKRNWKQKIKGFGQTK